MSDKPKALTRWQIDMAEPDSLFYRKAPMDSYLAERDALLSRCEQLLRIDPTISSPVQSLSYLDRTLELADIIRKAIGDGK